MNKFVLIFLGVTIVVMQVKKMEASDLPYCDISNTSNQESLKTIRRSLFNKGDSIRLRQIMLKALRGERIVIGVIGGSITQGANATRTENQYGSLVVNWWKEKFPNSEIKFINAGIGATGSAYGSFRAQDHLLRYNPDFVIVEFGVNDFDTKQSAESLEGLVRQILKQSNQPAVILLFMMIERGINAQNWQSKIGFHYELPMVSFRDALWPEIEAQKMFWKDIITDNVHPSDLGHYYAAKFVINVLEKVYKDIDAKTKLVNKQKKPLPEPLYSDVFEYTNLYPSSLINPISNQGWILAEGNWMGQCWRSDKPYATIEFEVVGSIVYILYYCDKGDMGQIGVKVDNGTTLILDGWGAQTWGAYMPVQRITKVLSPGKHKISIEILAQKHAESHGHEFRILGFATAGVNLKGN